MRIFYFCALVLATFMLPWWCAVVAMILYGFYYTSYESIILGMMLDAYVGASTWHLFYTVLAASIFLVAEFLRPRLSFHAPDTL